MKKDMKAFVFIAIIWLFLLDFSIFYIISRRLDNGGQPLQIDNLITGASVGLRDSVNVVFQLYAVQFFLINILVLALLYLTFLSWSKRIDKKMMKAKEKRGAKRRR